MSHDWHNNICSRSYNGTAKTNTIIDDHHPPVSTAFNPSARYTKPNNAPIETQKETGSTMTIHNSLSELIGNTPLVKLHHVTDGIKATIAVKVEYFNPGGSSKDRIAERIYQYSEVTSVYLMSGAFDFTVIIEGKTMREVAQFVSEKLSPMDSVLSTATHFVLKKYKDHGTVMCGKAEDERMMITP